MNCAIDLDGTLTNYPEFYKRIVQSFDNAYVLTARPETELSITIDDLITLGFKYQNFNDLIMYPISYIYEMVNDVPIYWDDSDNKNQFDSYKHREEYLENLKKLGKTILLDFKEMNEKLAQWKIQMCKELNIDVIFDDNPTFVERLRQAGIYAVHVDRTLKREGTIW